MAVKWLLESLMEPIDISKDTSETQPPRKKPAKTFGIRPKLFLGLWQASLSPLSDC
jgi:hypothetical protein